MKGQAAMEFLLTYGWAIMIVIIMVSGLAYFGVLNPQMFMPDKCFFGAGIGCVDQVFVKDSGTIKGTVIVKNNFGNPIIVSKVNITDLGSDAGCNCAISDCGISGLWTSSKSQTMNLSCSNIISGVNLRIRITYKNLDGEYDRMVEGKIQSSVIS